jgi:signal transduction histidine kinase
VIDINLFESLSSEDKEVIKKSLQDLIQQTYVLEEGYIKVANSYEELKKFLEQIVESLPNAIWVLDEKGEIFLQNSEAKKISTLLEFIKDSIDEEIEYEGKFYLVKRNEIDNKLILSVTDITEQKRKERLASMGQIAAHLSHEIRNPIGSVSLLASTLFNKVDIKSKPLVMEIKKSIWRVERIINATLLFTKGINPNITTFYVNQFEDVINEAAGYYSYTKDIDIEFDLPQTLMRADFELLSLVFQNFLFNAIDAIEEDDNSEEGRVYFGYKKESGFHSFIVKDSGKAIEDESLLFEPFKTTKTKGHGLGLSLSLQIIKSHKGSISLLKDEKGFKISIKAIE